MKFAKNALSLIAGLVLAGAAHAVVVSNPLVGNSPWQPLGEPDTTTYGQTFVTPDATNVQIDSFGFWVKSQDAATSKLRGYLAEWSGTGIVGPILFSSAVVSGNYADFTQLNFNTGGVVLDSSKTYVAFLSAAGLFDNVQDLLFVGTNNFLDSYAGGGFAYDNSNGAFPGANWAGCQGQAFCSDLAFDFVFSTPGNNVPEPATLLLMGVAAFAGRRALRSRRA